MRLNLRDAVAALLMAAIIAPYAGLLVRGQAPYIDDVRTMAAVALVLGVAAIVIADQLSTTTVMGRVEIGLALAMLALGVVAMVFAATASGQLLLGAFVTAIMMTWGVQLLDHAGWWAGPSGHRPTGPVRRTEADPRVQR
jgi:hypothetical protein